MGGLNDLGGGLRDVLGRCQDLGLAGVGGETGGGGEGLNLLNLLGG